MCMCMVTPYLKFPSILFFFLNLTFSNKGKQWRSKIHFWKSYQIQGITLCLEYSGNVIYSKVPKPKTTISSELYFESLSPHRFHPIAKIHTKTINQKNNILLIRAMHKRKNTRRSFRVKILIIYNWKHTQQNYNMFFWRMQVHLPRPSETAKTKQIKTATFNHRNRSIDDCKINKSPLTYHQAS